LGPQLAAEYAALKCRLAARYPSDRDAYIDAKGTFIRAALAAGGSPRP
jgi:GrpB-like predicted nucleotidyltransferase (UPF0157 family)